MTPAGSSFGAAATMRTLPLQLRCQPRRPFGPLMATCRKEVASYLGRTHGCIDQADYGC